MHVHTQRVKKTKRRKNVYIHVRKYIPLHVYAYAHTEKDKEKRKRTTYICPNIYPYIYNSKHTERKEKEKGEGVTHVQSAALLEICMQKWTLGYIYAISSRCVDPFGQNFEISHDTLPHLCVHNVKIYALD